MPLPPARDVRAPPPLPTSERPIPTTPGSVQGDNRSSYPAASTPNSTGRAVPPPPPPRDGELGYDEDQDDASANQTPMSTSRPTSKDDNFYAGAPPVPPTRPNLATDSMYSPPSSPTTSGKRPARAPPPLPPSSPTLTSSQTRAPPPPPPSHPPRRSTGESFGSPTAPKVPPHPQPEEDVTEYDGDYDTDIASSAKHKDALKAHNRDSSFEDGILTDEPTSFSPPPRAVPPVPPPSTVQDAPPPLPQSGPRTRKSTDGPRAPPPVPPGRELDAHADEYDPYRFPAPQQSVTSPSLRQPFSPVLHSPREELEQEDLYAAPRTVPSAPTERAPPPQSLPMPMPYSEPQRQSSEGPRTSLQTTRRSTEQSRVSSEGLIASDIDLAASSLWWTKQSNPPPVLQNRSDVLCEYETSTSTKRGGRSSVSLDVYALFMDYSQTTINVSFDPLEPSHAALEQKHDRPPPPPRQDQLEQASTQFGSRIADAASRAAGTTAGDGSPHSFVFDLVSTAGGPQALKPVGNRAYGALVYANLANASTQQFDEIRRGDIITFRNAKFVGHKGTLSQKYTIDVGIGGGGGHAGVVIEWDGTKRKVRVWEQQGRDSSEAGGGGGHGKKDRGPAKVKEESYRIGDLRSGEVRVWRVMGRSWVNWG